MNSNINTHNILNIPQCSCSTCCPIQSAVTDLVLMMPSVSPESALSLNMTADQRLACQKRQALVPCSRYYDPHIHFIGWGRVVQGGGSQGHILIFCLHVSHLGSGLTPNFKEDLEAIT